MSSRAVLLAIDVQRSFHQAPRLVARASAGSSCRVVCASRMEFQASLAHVESCGSAEERMANPRIVFKNGALRIDGRRHDGSVAYVTD